MLVHLQGSWNPLYGRLSLNEIPFKNQIIIGAFVFVLIVGGVILFEITYHRKWQYLWEEWLTSLDHKKIGVMYVILGLVMMFRGFIDATMIRTQQVMAIGPKSAGYLGALHGYLPPFHFGQIYSSHGTIMILFAVTPILTGLMNIMVPLQVGSRDMAFPYLNALSLWVTAAGAALVMVSLFIGDFTHAGWVGLIPLTELPYSPDVGTDYWMWAVQLSGLGSTLSSINLIATIVKMRAPGMGWKRVPIFTWTALSTSIIGVSAFPVLMAALFMLALDRYLGTHFFTASLGGNLMLYTNFFWIWGHPEVYFVVLPAFGIISEIIPTFAEKPLFGYMSMAAAAIAIAGLSWMVWLHHFFTMGAGPGVNLFFGTATMIVGIPTGVKVFNWMLTLYRGRLRFDSPMLWALGAFVLLVIGGLSGMMLAMPSIDYTLHNSVFLIAHFHSMMLLIAFSAIGGYVFWFPKVFGFYLDEDSGKRAFWFFALGTVLVFGSMYTLGFMGMTRRLDYIPFTSWRAPLIVEEIGIFFYCVASYYFFRQIHVSIRDRGRRPAGADPWQTTRSLEWTTPSPPPLYNFPLMPEIHGHDERAWRREKGLSSRVPDRYYDIVVPKNSAVPMVLGALAFGLGFGLVWRIWWMAGASLIGILLVTISRSFYNDTDYTIPAARVREIDNAVLSANGVPGIPGRTPEPDVVAPGMAELSLAERARRPHEVSNAAVFLPTASLPSRFPRGTKS